MNSAQLREKMRLAKSISVRDLTSFTDEIAGYHEIPDKLAGREGLLIRDEIRMVRPGFYLGRAYMGESFLLNFTVYNDAAAKAGKEGGAYSGATSIAPGVWVYQITKNGLALQATLQGTKYYKDDDLNKT